MKKALSLILALVMCLSLCACGSGNDTTSLTAREQLTELETILFNTIITITTNSFYEPSAARVIEVCDYENRTKYEDSSDLSYGPDTIVVRLQGENRVGGTVSHYYLICLTGAENTSEDAQRWIRNYNSWGYKESRMRYKATEGEYVKLFDGYCAEQDASDMFNIGRLNRALKEYWEEMGL